MAVTLCQGCGAEYAEWTGSCPACGNTASLKISRKTDQMIGRLVGGSYHVLKKLGQGGMGAVYLGENRRLDQKVALKFLNASLVNEPDIVRRFLNEAKTYGRLAHPNAVTVLDLLQEEDETLCIVMEYVEGADLRRAIAERGRLQPGEAIDIALQVADVLQQAHSMGIVHRDLKPENIMVRPSNRGYFAKVLDFGIARLLHENASRLTAQGAIAGTPRYMPPEQVEGRDVDARADVYALGVVLFEMVTGQPPFDGATITEILQHQVSTPMPHLWNVDPALDLPILDDVIQRATRKYRVERYPSMQALAQDLSNALPTLVSMPAPALRAPSGAVAVVNAGGGTLSYGVSPTLQSARTDLGLAEELPAGGEVEVKSLLEPAPEGGPSVRVSTSLAPGIVSSVAPSPAPAPAEPPATVKGNVLSEPPPTVKGSVVGAGEVDPFMKTAAPAPRRTGLGEVLPDAESFRPSRAPWVAGAVGVVLLAGIGLYSTRDEGKAAVAAPGGTQDAPPAAAPGAAPPAPSDAPAAGAAAAAGAPVAVPGEAPARASAAVDPPAETAATPPTAVPGKPPGGASAAVAAAAADLERRAEGARDSLRKARRAWEGGELSRARALLEDMPGLPATDSERAQLLADVEKTLSQLSSARGRADRGDCRQAILDYGAVLKLNPAVAEAREGREKCRRMLPPDLNE